MKNSATGTQTTIHSVVPCSNCQTHDNVHLINAETLEVVNVLNSAAGMLLFLCKSCLEKARRSLKGAPSVVKKA